MSVNVIGGSYIVMNSFLPLGSNSLHAIWIYIWTLKSECSYQDYDPCFALLLVFSWLDLWSPIDPNNCNVISCQYGLACFWNVLQLPTCIVIFHAIYLWLFTVFSGWFSMPTVDGSFSYIEIFFSWVFLLPWFHLCACNFLRSIYLVLYHPSYMYMAVQIPLSPAFFFQCSLPVIGHLANMCTTPRTRPCHNLSLLPK